MLPPSRFARFGPVVAVIVCAVSLAVVVFSAFFAHSVSTGLRLLALGVGVLGLFVGVAMVAPSLARPLASFLGRPATVVGGVAGELARSNSMRNPSRTASTASALMIGLALVTVVAVLAQGIKSQFESAVSKRVQGRLRADLAERLPRRRGSTRPRRSASPGVATAVAGVRAGDGQGVREHDPGHRRRSGDLADDRDRLAGGLERVARDPRAHRRDPGQVLRQEPPPRRRLADPDRDARRGVPRPEGDGDRGPAARRLAVRAGDDLRRRRSTRSTRTRRTSSAS